MGVILLILRVTEASQRLANERLGADILIVPASTAGKVEGVLETLRVDLGRAIASAASSSAILGCSGGVLEPLICITGTWPAVVIRPYIVA